jgi:hypothetical protein
VNYGRNGGKLRSCGRERVQIFCFGEDEGENDGQLGDSEQIKKFEYKQAFLP